MLRSRLLQALLALVLTVTAQSARAGQPTATDAQTGADVGSVVAALSGQAGKLGRQTALPSPLSPSDAQLYRSALDAGDHAQWAAADRDIARLHDRILVGHLLAQRYLATTYRPQVDELKDWMAQYADLPEAADIFELAQQRYAGHLNGIRPPVQGERPQKASSGRDDDPMWEEFSVESNRELSVVDRRRLQDLKERFRTLVHQTKYDQAVALFENADLKRIFDPVDYDELKTVLAVAYFTDGRDADAGQWAEQAADRSGNVLPESHWVAGLALWRAGQHGAQAARHFEAVGNANDVSTWLVSAGAYWAARANLAAGRPELVNHWLQRAAAYPRTFYGLLARRALGEDVQYSWEVRPFTDLDAETLLRVPGARRALALLQIGDRNRAEEELSRLTENAGPALSQSMLALANAGSLPAVAVSLGKRADAVDVRQRDSADYPLPDWRPTSGWSIDRALVLAIARQESAFNPHAKSPCGAIGLMQLMPKTAHAMGAAGKLADPQVNLELGQRYVRRLLDDDAIKGNLLFFTASYNSGPGNVTRWLQTVHHNGDALLFLESMPSHETRAFVARVMTNFWTYRNRLGQTSPSLDAIAGGDWPLYDGPASKAQAVKYVEN